MIGMMLPPANAFNLDMNDTFESFLKVRPRLYFIRSEFNVVVKNTYLDLSNVRAFSNIKVKFTL